MTLNVSIEGIWSTKAGDYNPQKKISTPTTDYRFFYRLNQDSTACQKVITEITLDGKIFATQHDWMSNDGREDNFFDIPLELRTVGAHKLQFNVYAPTSDAADAGPGEPIFQSEAFDLEFTAPAEN